MYEGRLVAHSSVGGRILGDLLPAGSTEEGAPGEDVAQSPLIFVDTAGSLMYEEVDQ